MTNPQIQSFLPFLNETTNCSAPQHKPVIWSLVSAPLAFSAPALIYCKEEDLGVFVVVNAILGSLGFCTSPQSSKSMRGPQIINFLLIAAD